LSLPTTSMVTCWLRVCDEWKSQKSLRWPVSRRRDGCVSRAAPMPAWWRSAVQSPIVSRRRKVMHQGDPAAFHHWWSFPWSRRTCGGPRAVAATWPLSRRRCLRVCSTAALALPFSVVALRVAAHGLRRWERRWSGWKIRRFSTSQPCI